MCVVVRALRVAGRASRVVRRRLWVVRQMLSNLATFSKIIWQQFDTACYCPRDLPCPWQTYSEACFPISRFVLFM